MKLLCDEGVERQVVDRLREEGHNVLYVAEMQPGIPDNEVLSLSSEHQSVLVTTDKDFGELVFRLRQAALGVIFIRLHGQTPDEKANTVSTALRRHGDETVGSFSVIEIGKMRIRKHWPRY